MVCCSYVTFHEADERMAMHRHQTGYASLVVDGQYVEASIDGRYTCEPGRLILHPPFHAHQDDIGARGARVLNNAWAAGPVNTGVSVWQVPDRKEAVGVLERAPHLLNELVQTCQPVPRDPLPQWQEALLGHVMEGDLEPGKAAAAVGVSVAHASRAIRCSIGVTPQEARLEAKWRRAWEMMSAEYSLAEIAFACGFTDQSHLCRVTRRVSGHTPGQIRRQMRSLVDQPCGQ